MSGYPYRLQALWIALLALAWRVPMRLAFGLYRGAPWLPVVNRLIVGYQPPAPPPSMIELNSMSLFKSGSAVLTPGSNRVLVADDNGGRSTEGRPACSR